MIGLGVDHIATAMTSYTFCKSTLLPCIVESSIDAISLGYWTGAAMPGHEH